MNGLQDLIGRETDMAQLARTIRLFAETFDLPLVGALHVTCSDETEGECIQAFQQLFAQMLLPPIEADRRAPLRTMNLGGRYEPGSIHIADEHFDTPEARGAAKLLVVKINSHVAVRPAPDGATYGSLQRYGNESPCCGAVMSMLAGSTLPAASELRQTFTADGIDRVAVLGDEQRVRPEHRALLAAVVNARLQAARAVADIAAHAPVGPAVFLVLPCVTVNRNEPDTEILVGEYGIDATGVRAEVKYHGLGDSPGQYRVRHEHTRATLADDQWPDG